MDQTQSSGSGVPSDLVYWQSLGGEGDFNCPSARIDCMVSFKPRIYMYKPDLFIFPGYEGPYSTCSIRASIPGMLQQPLGNYSGAGEMQMTARYTIDSIRLRKLIKLYYGGHRWLQARAYQG